VVEGLRDAHARVDLADEAETTERGQLLDRELDRQRVEDDPQPAGDGRLRNRALQVRGGSGLRPRELRQVLARGLRAYVQPARAGVRGERPPEVRREGRLVERDEDGHATGAVARRNRDRPGPDPRDLQLAEGAPDR